MLAFGYVAQGLEHSPVARRVAGSSPFMSVTNMTRTIERYSRVGTYGVVAILRALAVLGRSRVAGAATTGALEEKLSAYECGFEPYDDGRLQFQVHYYLVARLYLVLDLEVCYRYPWVFTVSSAPAYARIREFILELRVGYAYVWLVGALEW